MTLQLSNTSFAASEGVMESFYRPRTVFSALIRYTDLEEGYLARGESARLKRQESFQNPINSRELIKKVYAPLRKVGTVRHYLRAFD